MTWEEVDQVWEHLSPLGIQSIQPLCQLALSSKKSSAACGMRALGRIPHPDSLTTLVNLLEERSSKGEPIEALVGLGQYALPTILELTHDAKADVRQMAAYALGKIGDPDTSDRLLEMADSDRSKKVRETATRALLWLTGEEECDVDLRDFWGNVMENVERIETQNQTETH